MSNTLGNDAKELAQHKARMTPYGKMVGVKATVTDLKPVWLSETAQGWHVHGTLTSVTGTENWGAAVDDAGNPLVGRWLDMTKGWASEEDKRVVLAAIEHAIIMSGTDLD